MTEKTRDYSATLFLPQTNFPMRAGLPQKEPELLARWQRLNLYRRLREASAGRARFIAGAMFCRRSVEKPSSVRMSARAVGAASASSANVTGSNRSFMISSQRLCG